MPATFLARPGLAGLVEFCKADRRAAAAAREADRQGVLGRAREICAILPRGNSKTTVAAKIAVHHLLTVDGAAVTIGAASRDQARIAFERTRGFVQHPALGDAIVVRCLKLRHADGDGLLRVVPCDGPRVHGLSSTLYITDEVWFLA